MGGRYWGLGLLAAIGCADDTAIERHLAASMEARQDSAVARPDGGPLVTNDAAGTNALGPEPANIVDAQAPIVQTSSAHRTTADARVAKRATDASFTSEDAADDGRDAWVALPLESDAETDPPDSGSSSLCQQTVGRCDAVGECAIESCLFEESGLSCAYTPERSSLYTCVVAGTSPAYSACELDDQCAPGSVCISNPVKSSNGDIVRSGFVCRPTCRFDVDCGDEQWCQQATDDNNEIVPDIRVCHKYCLKAAECGTDADLVCGRADTNAPLDTQECMRRPKPKDNSASALDAGMLSVRWRLEREATSCQTVFDCNSDEECLDNVCRSGCSDDADCGSSLCAIVDGVGVCGAECNVDPAAGSTCGTVPNNCGCQDGESCKIGVGQASQCTADGHNAIFAWCYDSEDCASGLSCISGLCRKPCIPGVYDCAPSEGRCSLALVSSGDTTYACVGHCDPVDPSLADETHRPCGLGAYCYPGLEDANAPQALCVAETPTARPKLHGESCLLDFDCESGLGCGPEGTCTPWCRSDADCTDGWCRGHGRRFGDDFQDPIGVCTPGVSEL